MESNINKQKRERETICYFCSHDWTYRGKNDFRASCPHCGRIVVFSKEKRLRDEK